MFVEQPGHRDVAQTHVTKALAKNEREKTQSLPEKEA